MLRYPSLPVRLWRRRPWSTNPLMRGSDRLESVVWMVVVVVMMAVIPIAGAAGTAEYTSAAERIRVENATKAAVTATVLEEPKRIAGAESEQAMTDRFEAPVRWVREGQERTATIEIPLATKPGDRLPMWIGGDDGPTTPPQPSAAAATSGIVVALALFAEVWVGAVALAWITGALLNVRRHMRWDREWRLITGPMGKEFR
ncbi:Rv1733c family protein [Nocardia brevicatena]|uniref:Rv1733c family protein n=1 Tax=Nocardia brevicatena TaxID=37327 RepID=UPI0012FCF122|nr:hypothetical protein [Nocardia brevicatena]